MLTSTWVSSISWCRRVRVRVRVRVSANLDLGVQYQLVEEGANRVAVAVGQFTKLTAVRQELEGGDDATAKMPRASSEKHLLPGGGAGSGQLTAARDVACNSL